MILVFHEVVFVGYDPDANPPNYGKADKIVVDNTNDIKAHDSDWNEIAEKVIIPYPVQCNHNTISA